MEHHQYLIIGGGMTADAAAHGIREIDARGRIGIINSETDAPYNRPPLTKALWKGEPLESVWRHTESEKVDLHLGRTAQALDPARKTITDDRKTTYTYGKLLLATGGSVRALPFGNGEIIYFRTLKDYRRLRALTEKGRRFAVIGGGFIGSELAAALALNKKEVTMIFPGQGICNRVFPTALSKWVTDFYRQKGVAQFSGESVAGLERRGEQFALSTKSGLEILVDGVVAGMGITPNVELAEAAGLPIENGIIVDEFLRTADPDIYAAGDVAAFFNPALGKRLRVEHEDNANTMGRLVGRNMAGQSEPYHHLPMFYSDLFELGYEAVGELDARLETFADWKRPNEEGVIYYLKDRRVRGVLLWNIWGQLDAARALIAEPGPFTMANLAGRLPVETVDAKT
jgi:3-phenylpropionate/trans-cinnamate dioxygenase ferredoxin reductase component